MEFKDWVDLQEGKSQAERIAAVAVLLGENRRTVESWYYLDKAPRPVSAATIVLKSGGQVDYNGIYGPFAAKKTRGG